MISAEVPAETASRGRTVDYVLPWSIVVVRVLVAYLASVVAEVDEVEICRRDVEGRAAEVSRHRESLQEYLGTDDGRAEVCS